MRGRSLVLVASAAMVVGAVAAVAWALVAGGHRTRIEHPAALYAEALDLARELPSGAVPEHKWPRELRALRPRRVVLFPDRLWIWMGGGGVGKSRGYEVYFDASKIPLGDVTGTVTLTRTKHPNIVAYETR